MFWRKKTLATAAAMPGGVTTTAGEVTAPVTAPAKRTAEKLSGPREIPELAGRHLVVAKKKDPDWVWHLKAVIRRNPGRGKKAFDVRVYEESRMSRAKIKVKDWTTFDQHPELLLYEGWYDKDSVRADLVEKNAAPPVPAQQ